MSKCIIGSQDVDLSQLIQAVGNSDWVSQGKAFMSEGNKCPFCQHETITDEFRSRLSAYFNQSFADNIVRLNQLHESYENASLRIQKQLSTIVDTESVNPYTKLDINLFKANVAIVASRLKSNLERIKNKIKEPSRAVCLDSTRDVLDSIKQLIDDANKKVEKHNALVANYNTEHKKLVSDVWRYFVEEYRHQIKSYQSNLAVYDSKIATYTQKKKELGVRYRVLKADIEVSIQNVTGVEPTVNKINQTLMSYGFNNFRIVASERNPNHYRICRGDGSLADSTLSEGEITFITLLYFLQLAEGGFDSGTAAERRILVIDDPVSGLDSKMLSVVSSLIESVIVSVEQGEGLVEQIVILTHNAHFYSKITARYTSADQNENCRFWVLQKQRNETTIHPYSNVNPIQTSGELFWS